jgi:transcriptional regulator with XRE-family HTH domain
MSLAELVAQERQRQGLSLREVAERSGGAVAHTTVHAIEQGRRGEVDDATLRGLAKGLGLRVGVVRKAAGLAAKELPPFELPAGADRLSLRERRMVRELVEVLLEAKRR